MTVSAVAQPPAPTATVSSRYDFYGRGPYRKSVPRPSALLGYEAGERHSTFRDQERVLLAIANAAKDRVRLVDYGLSAEGRPLRLLLVSAPENLSHLEAIRSANLQLADPRRLKSDAEGDEILRKNPVLSWINHTIHGNESASFEAVMWTLYTLAASESPEVKEILKNSVVILNPAFNPDGHERFVVWYNSVAVGSPERWAYEKSEPWAIHGRFNHYRFDMNRDKLAQSQPETQQETAFYLRWYPQVFVDQHGQPETYFFPPNSAPTHFATDPARVGRWTDLFGRANAAAFDRYGWAYVTRETFDLFYPGYLDSFTTLCGAIGMTYETDGGGNLARRRDDETISTLRDATAHHFEAALTTLSAAAKNREALLRDFLAYRRGALQASEKEPLKRIVLLPGSDPNRAAALAAHLLRMGIEVHEAKVPFESAKAHAYLSSPTLPSPLSPKNREERETTGILPSPVLPPLPGASADASAGGAGGGGRFPAGALIVDLAQPQGRLAKAILEPNPAFTPEFVREQQARRVRNEKKNENESREGYDFYDITAWALPYSYNVDAWWTEEAPQVDSRLLTLDAKGETALTTQNGGVRGGRAQVAYLFRYDRDAAATLALRLLQEDYRLAVVTKPARIGGQQWPRGTLIARVSRNPESLHARIAVLAKALGVEVVAIQSGYSDEAPVGLGSDSIANLKRPAIAVVEDDKTSISSFGALWYLLERQVGQPFTPLRLSSLLSADLSRFNVIVFPEGGGYASALGKPGLDRLREWAEKGGALIGLGSGGTWFTEKDANLTAATLVGEDKPDDKPKPGEKKPATPTPLPGAIFRAKIDSTHFLGYGYERGELAVPLDGATFLKPTTKGSNVVTFGSGPLTLAGFVWANNTETLLANTAYVIDEPIGAGHAILYLSDPTFRALWPGLRRLFLSSILFAPSRSPLESR